MIEPLITENKLIKSVYLSIYSFHMPVFIIISGMLTKIDLSDDWKSKLTRTILIPLITFTVLYELFNVITEGEFSDYTKNLRPYWILWYLFSLYLWKLMLPFFLKNRYPVFLAIALSILSGYISSIGLFFSLSRTFYFFSFFIIGYKLTPLVLAHVHLLKFSKLLFFGVLALNFIIFSIYSDLPHQWLWGSHSYAELGNNDWSGGVIRLALFGVSILTAMSVLFLIPNKKWLITDKGKNSLYVYLWHGFFVKILISAGLISYFKQMPSIIALISLFVFALIISLILSTNIVSRATHRYIFSPAASLVK